MFTAVSGLTSGIPCLNSDQGVLLAIMIPSSGFGNPIVSAVHGAYTRRGKLTGKRFVA